jgi:hypothetical protein
MPQTTLRARTLNIRPMPHRSRFVRPHIVVKLEDTGIECVVERTFSRQADKTLGVN